MREAIQKFCLKLGYEIRKYADPFQAQQQLLSCTANPVIFDVGAYHGYITSKYKSLFPTAQIYSFEPFTESFAILEKRTQNNPDIHSYNLALSNKTGTAEFRINSSAETNSLFATDTNAANSWGAGLMETHNVVTVNTTTLDEFVDTHRIEKIDLLKIDVQGAEYLVLEGAQKTLAKNSIKIIYSEIITTATYENQKNFSEIVSLFYNFGFELYNFYNIYPTKRQIMTMDAIFVRKQPNQK
ncbi:MAG: FkbM family methyltransferase [Sedimentisphaerales bacterium]|nr:FkbM family methyltransferase [Sedimentisphaerales bacterium]